MLFFNRRRPWRRCHHCLSFLLPLSNQYINGNLWIRMQVSDPVMDSHPIWGPEGDRNLSFELLHVTKTGVEYWTYRALGRMQTLPLLDPSVGSSSAWAGTHTNKPHVMFNVWFSWCLPNAAYAYGDNEKPPWNAKTAVPSHDFDEWFNMQHRQPRTTEEGSRDYQGCEYGYICKFIYIDPL